MALDFCITFTGVLEILLISFLFTIRIAKQVKRNPGPMREERYSRKKGNDQESSKVPYEFQNEP